MLPILALLREERKRQKLSQDAVGAIAGYCRPTISRWESGVQRISADALTNWAEALGCELKITQR